MEFLTGVFPPITQWKLALASLYPRARFASAFTLQLYESLCALRYLAARFYPYLARLCEATYLLWCIAPETRHTNAFAWPSFTPFPPSLSLLLYPPPFVAPRFLTVTRALRQWYGEIRETSLSKVVHPQHFAVHRPPQVKIICTEFDRIPRAKIALVATARRSTWNRVEKSIFFEKLRI